MQDKTPPKPPEPPVGPKSRLIKDSGYVVIYPIFVIFIIALFFI